MRPSPFMHCNKSMTLNGEYVVTECGVQGMVPFFNIVVA